MDNVCRQVIERHLLKSLHLSFCPEKVAGYTDEELICIAAESTEDLERRAYLEDTCRKLEFATAELRK